MVPDDKLHYSIKPLFQINVNLDSLMKSEEIFEESNLSEASLVDIEDTCKSKTNNLQENHEEVQ